MSGIGASQILSSARSNAARPAKFRAIDKGEWNFGRSTNLHQATQLFAALGHFGLIIGIAPQGGSSCLAN
jgi:hypothetical protein